MADQSLRMEDIVFETFVPDYLLHAMQAASSVVLIVAFAGWVVFGVTQFFGFLESVFVACRGLRDNQRLPMDDVADRGHAVWPARDGEGDCGSPQQRLLH